MISELHFSVTRPGWALLFGKICDMRFLFLFEDLGTGDKVLCTTFSPLRWCFWCLTSPYGLSTCICIYNKQQQYQRRIFQFKEAFYLHDNNFTRKWWKWQTSGGWLYGFNIFGLKGDEVTFEIKWHILPLTNESLIHK